MLASRPSRPNAGGLPSGPRSHSVGRSRQEESSRHDRAPSRTPSRNGRPQKSTFPREPSRSRVPADSRSISKRSIPPHSYYTTDYDTRSEVTGSNRKSDDSATSSGSSLFDRLKSGASSLTSFDDGERSMKSPPSYRRGRSLRDRGSEPSSPEESEPSSAFGKAGDGSKIWSRVASAASELTVSVSKAWATNIVTYAGEETPPGKESRLTRAMKAYHLDKARSPSDLPSWLFTPEERKPPPPRATTRSPTVRSPLSPLRDEEPVSLPRPRGFRDIYDAAAGKSDRTVERSNTEVSAPSKTTDRLKAIRDAKRSALTGTTVPSHDEDRVQARIGLPSGPRTRRV